MWGGEEGRIRISTEGVTEDPEGARRVAEGPSDLMGRSVLDEESAEGLVLALLCSLRAQEETTAGC
jgi:hypothetical protein